MTGPSLLSSSGTQPVALRASARLRLVLAAFVALCAAAVGGVALQLADGQFAGKAGAVFVGLLTAASLAAVARETCARRIPAALRIETATGTLAAYDHAGRRVAHGAAVRCTHWADRLLVLAIARERGAPVPLVVPADALDAAAFRALVGARQALGACRARLMKVRAARFRGRSQGVATMALRVASLVIE